MTCCDQMEVSDLEFDYMLDEMDTEIPQMQYGYTDVQGLYY